MGLREKQIKTLPTIENIMSSTEISIDHRNRIWKSLGLGTTIPYPDFRFLGSKVTHAPPLDTSVDTKRIKQVVVKHNKEESNRQIYRGETINLDEISINKHTENSTAIIVINSQLGPVVWAKTIVDQHTDSIVKTVPNGGFVDRRKVEVWQTVAGTGRWGKPEDSIKVVRMIDYYDPALTIIEGKWKNTRITTKGIPKTDTKEMKHLASIGMPVPLEYFFVLNDHKQVVQLNSNLNDSTQINETIVYSDDKTKEASKSTLKEYLPHLAEHTSYSSPDKVTSIGQLSTENNTLNIVRKANKQEETMHNINTSGDGI